jgi:type IV secretion system protein VirD4
MSRTMLCFTATTTASVAYLYLAGPPVTVGGPLVAGLVVAGAGLGWWRYGRNASRVVRAGERTRRKHGMASTLDAVRYGSAASVRRKAPHVRPSIAQLGHLARLRLPTAAAGVQLCKVGGLTIWASTEDAVLVLGAPRRGKTGWLAARILDAPGACVSTSTRDDLIRLTAAHRAKLGPVFIYNPAALGGIESTLAFDPLDGCADPQVATDTAVDMIPASTGEGERWDTQARRVLAVLLHAAALAGPPVGVGIVGEWVADPDNPDYQREILTALRGSPDLAHVEVAKQFLTTNTRTRSSITSSIMPALGWLTCPPAVAALRAGPTKDPDVHRVQLNIPDLVTQRGSVFLLGRHEAHTAGLLAALTGRIVRQARILASYQPGGRLDPPLTLALDEAARIAPIPLPDISGDCGGTGITLLAVFQSRADIVNRWGASGASTVVTNCGVRVLFGGSADPDELRGWSELADQREEKARNYDAGGNSTGHGTRKTPVLPTSLLSNPGRGRVIVFHHAMPPIIGKVTMAWRRPDVRNTRRWRLVGARIAHWRAAVTPTAPTQRPPAPTAHPVPPTRPVAQSPTQHPAPTGGDA